MLKKLGFVEGTIPNIYVSAKIAEIIDERAQYTKNKAMDDKYYIDLIIKYLIKWKKGTKSNFVELLGDKLPDILNEKQKIDKVRNLLTQMRCSELIEHADGNKRTGVWVLTKKDMQ